MSTTDSFQEIKIGEKEVEERSNDDHVTNNEYNNGELESKQNDKDSTTLKPSSLGIKCSAVSALERGMPDHDYSDLIEELRSKILKEFELYPGVYCQIDIDKCREDDWYLARFLLRNKLNLDNSMEMLKKTLRFKHESMVNTLKAQDFPEEFYKVGGMFSYGHDRKGNKLLYMRIKLHRKMPEIQTILESFIIYNINKIDNEAKGKGISVVLDCTDGGYNNADMDSLKFMITSLVNYFPKGFSYMLIHNQPWILKPFWQVAKLCIPAEYVQLVKFSNSTTIFEYIDKEQLPDFLGGTAEFDQKQVPANCTTLKQAAKLWGIEKETVKKILMRFADSLPPETIDQFEKDYDIQQEEKETTTS